MKSQIYLWQIILACLFAGVFLGVVVYNWDLTWFGVHAIVIAGILLFVTYLVVVLIVRQSLLKK
jgi:formate hydrogenlyase subunit 4